MKTQIVYVAGPYTADTPEQVHLNVNAAMEVASRLFGKGHIPVIPHLSHFWHLYLLTKYGSSYDYEDWIRYTLVLLDRCDAIYYMSSSPGADGELRYAMELQELRPNGFPIYRKMSEVPDARR